MSIEKFLLVQNNLIYQQWLKKLKVNQIKSDKATFCLNEYPV